MSKPLIAVLLTLFSTVAHAKETVSPAARTIVLVRHGHYVPDPSVDEKLGPALSPLGVTQAKLLGARLASMSVDARYVSPMQRARDTAAVSASDIASAHFASIEDLAECTPPTRRADVMAEGDAESFGKCKAQLDRVFAAYFRPAAGGDKTDLFVCHGNVIRYLVTRALGVDPDAWLEMSVGHASITRIRVEADGSFKVIAVGDVGHLPANMLTGASGDPERSLAIPALSR